MILLHTEFPTIPSILMLISDKRFKLINLFPLHRIRQGQSITRYERPNIDILFEKQIKMKKVKAMECQKKYDIQGGFSLQQVINNKQMFDTSFSKEPGEEGKKEQGDSVLSDIHRTILAKSMVKLTSILERKITHQKLITFEIINIDAERRPVLVEEDVQLILLKLKHFERTIASTIHNSLSFQKQTAFHKLYLNFRVQKQNKKASLAKNGCESNLRSRQQSISLRSSMDQLRANNAKLKDKLKSKKTPFQGFSKKLESMLQSHQHFLDSL